MEVPAGYSGTSPVRTVAEDLFGSSTRSTHARRPADQPTPVLDTMFDLLWNAVHSPVKAKAPPVSGARGAAARA